MGASWGPETALPHPLTNSCSSFKKSIMSLPPEFFLLSFLHSLGFRDTWYTYGLCFLLTHEWHFR